MRLRCIIELVVEALESSILIEECFRAKCEGAFTDWIL